MVICTFGLDARYATALSGSSDKLYTSTSKFSKIGKPKAVIRSLRAIPPTPPRHPWALNDHYSRSEGNRACYDHYSAYNTSPHSDFPWSPTQDRGLWPQSSPCGADEDLMLLVDQLLTSLSLFEWVEKETKTGPANCYVCYYTTI